MFCECLSLPFCYFPIFRTLFWLLCVDFSSKSKFHGFILLFLLSCFLSFFLSSCFCQNDLMAEDETRHQEKWVKPVVTMVNKVWKGGLSLGVFFSAWTKVSVDGPESTKENAMADDFWLGFGSNSVFLVIEWLVCDTDSPRDTRKWMLIIVSLCFLSLHSYSPHVYPPSSTLGKKLLERLGNLRRWGWTWTIKWSVSKIKGRRSC